MADLVFNKSKGTLTAFGRIWSAVAGTTQFQPLTPGAYSVPPGALKTGTEPAQGVVLDAAYAFPAFKDRTGFGWFLSLGRGSLGLHPRGAVPGMSGGIEVTNISTRDLFNELHKRNAQSLSVVVE